jgi:hypothetical protein
MSRSAVVPGWPASAVSSMFGVTHWITFCESGANTPLGRPATKVDGCAEYNQVDNNKPKPPKTK